MIWGCLGDSRSCYFKQQLDTIIVIKTMIRILTTRSYHIPLHNPPTFPISVYEGISPSLLATMSLSQGIRGTTNNQLIDSLVKSNIIRNRALVDAMKKYDRRDFVPLLWNKGNVYENRPYKIAGGQSMTDIFTHAVILEQVADHMEQIVKQNTIIEAELKILDIGTGNGYLAFVISSLISSIFKKSMLGFNVMGIDSNHQAIEFSKSLKNKYETLEEFPEVKNINFQAESFEDTMNKQDSYDIVIGGFYMPPAFNEILSQKLKKSTSQTKRPSIGIWPTDSTSGQSLYNLQTSLSKQKSNEIKVTKNQIMSTMFSMPTVKTGVSKYFIEDRDKQEPQNQRHSQSQNHQEVRQKILKLKLQKKNSEKKEIRQQLKQAIQKHGSRLNKKLTLTEMKQIPEINDLLKKLNSK